MTKGTAGLMISIIPSIFFLFVYLTTLYFLIQGFILTDINTLDLDSALITTRLLHSPTGISYEDPLTHRLYPHIVDDAKLTASLEERLEQSLFFGKDNTKYAAKITVNTGSTPAEFYYNEDQYHRWQPLATKPIIWGPKTTLVMHQMGILLRQSDHLIPATLTVEVVAQP